MKGKNTIATIFRVLGVIAFIAGFIFGIVFAIIKTEHEITFSFSLAFAIWGGAFVSGMMWLAIGEVISLLQRIADNTEKRVITPSPLPLNNEKRVVTPSPLPLNNEKRVVTPSPLPLPPLR